MTTQAKTSMLEQLTAIVGAGNATADPAVLEKYSRDQSLAPARRPHFVVKPKNADEISAVVKLANVSLMPVVPFSSGKDFKGAAIPDQGGILLDLSRMNRILDMDTLHWHATVEPGVTFAQLNAELKKHGLRVEQPLFTPSTASVLVTYLESEPTPQAADFVFGNEQVNDIIAIMPNGDSFTMGNISTKGATHNHPGGPGLDFYRLFVRGQGTMGIVHQMNVRCIPIPKAWKIVFSPFDSIDTLQAAVKKIQRQELGLECFALNAFDLASILVDEDASDAKSLKAGNYVGNTGAKPWSAAQIKRFDALRAALPPWTLVMSIPAWGRRIEEKVAYQENDLRTLAATLSFDVEATVARFMNLDKLFAEELTAPWRGQKKFGFKGTCQSLMFMAVGNNIKPIEDTIKALAARYRYSADDIGIYIQPIERARTFYCMFDIHCNAADPAEAQRIKAFYDEASEAVASKGAFFDRPYGVWANIMYRRNGVYAEYLKKLKRDLDPNLVLNPGKLCF